MGPGGKFIIYQDYNNVVLKPICYLRVKTTIEPNFRDKILPVFYFVPTGFCHSIVFISRAKSILHISYERWHIQLGFEYRTMFNSKILIMKLPEWLQKILYQMTLLFARLRLILNITLVEASPNLDFSPPPPTPPPPFFHSVTFCKISCFWYIYITSISERLTPRLTLHGRLPSMVVFHWRSSSIEGCLLSQSCPQGTPKVNQAIWAWSFRQ